jgi:sec-independent protein translocase protein TatA
VFGTKRLKNVGQDLGEAVRGFKKGMQGDDDGKVDDAGKPGDAVVPPSEATPPGDDERTPPSPR